jgi:hypothetical protein
MKEDKKLMDFDDTETAEDLHKAFISEFGELTDEEIDKLFEKTFVESNKE